MLEIAHKPDLPTLLVIDDDMVSREVMATVLTMTGYTVHTAESGEASLELLTAGKCAPSVILVDAQMPGLSGTQLIEGLRARSTARVVSISASKAPDAVLAASDGFLLKPFDAEALQNLLEGQDLPAAPLTASPAGENSSSIRLDPATPVVSAATLAQLREMMPEAAVKQIYTAIVADLNKRLPMLEDAIAKGDIAEAGRIGHAIKGGCGMAGALQAAELGALLQAGVLDVAVPAGQSSRNQLDNSSSVISNLRVAARNLESMIKIEFQA
jgi:CheY-like chemotaxis protein